MIGDLGRLPVHAPRAPRLPVVRVELAAGVLRAAFAETVGPGSDEKASRVEQVHPTSLIGLT